MPESIEQADYFPPLSEACAIDCVSQFFEEQGLSIRRITPKTHPSLRKMPDLEVTSASGLLFYAEIKSLELKYDPDFGGFRHTTTLSKIAKHLCKGAKQLMSVNSNHFVPNVMIWLSNHFQLNWSSFVDVLQGYLAFGDNVYTWQGLDSWKRIARSSVDIDLHIWLQINSATQIYETHYVMTSRDPFLSENLRRMLQLDRIPVRSTTP